MRWFNRIFKRSKRINLKSLSKLMYEVLSKRKISRNKLQIIMVILAKVHNYNYIVNDRTLEGLVYYLKVPKDKENQEKRFR